MLPRWLSGKESACWCRSCRRHGFDPWVRNIPWQPTPVWEFQGQRSLVDNSPQGDKRVRQGWACTHICTIYLYPFICQWILSCLPVQAPGAGTGNLLQCSCLENPIDRGVWRARVHGVAKSWTRLSDFHFPSLEKEMATHFNFLAWKIPWMEESGGLQSIGWQRVGHNVACMRASYVCVCVCVVVWWGFHAFCLNLNLS